MQYVNQIGCVLYVVQNWDRHRLPRIYVYFLHTPAFCNFVPENSVSLIHINASDKCQPNFAICYDCGNIDLDGRIILAITK